MVPFPFLKSFLFSLCSFWLLFFSWQLGLISSQQDRAQIVNLYVTVLKSCPSYTCGCSAPKKKLPIFHMVLSIEPEGDCWLGESSVWEDMLYEDSVTFCCRGPSWGLLVRRGVVCALKVSVQTPCAIWIIFCKNMWLLFESCILARMRDILGEWCTLFSQWTDGICIF